jgi:hypothetical protein
MPQVNRADRFWRQVFKTKTCWFWIGAVSKNGYGAFIEGRGNVRTAHRVAYELAIGPIPTGQLVRHSCDTPLCMNPLHLLLGTDADNGRDRTERGHDYFEARRHLAQAKKG